MKFRKFIAGILSAGIMMSIPCFGLDMPASAVMLTWESAGGFDYLVRSDGTLDIQLAFGEKGGELVIPAKINGRKVAKLSFGGKKGITSVTLPEGLEEISSDAFKGCTGLKKVTIPSSVRRIEDSAFRDCTALEKITLPKKLEFIGGWAFSGCSSLKSVKIPNSVTVMKGFAFNGCSSLEKVTISDNLDTLEYSVFDSCKSLKNVEIPSSVTTIGLDAFEGCTQLESVSLPDGLQKIEGNAFSKCESLTRAVIPSTVTEIGDGAFGGCKALTNLVIPSSVKTFGNAVYTLNICANCPKVTIYCKQNSAAWKYAGKFDIPRKNVKSSSFVQPSPYKPSAVKNAKGKKTVSGTLSVSWDKQSGADGYVLYKCMTINGEYERVGVYSGTSATVSGLWDARNYYFMIRAYKTVDGKKIYGSFSDPLWLKT